MAQWQRGCTCTRRQCSAQSRCIPPPRPAPKHLLPRCAPSLLTPPGCGLAVTEENVALLARQALAARGQVNASTLVEEYPNDFTGIIGLHTYSQSPHREYDITMTGNWVERGGFRFQDFVLTRRKEVNTDGNH